MKISEIEKLGVEDLRLKLLDQQEEIRVLERKLRNNNECVKKRYEETEKSKIIERRIQDQLKRQQKISSDFASTARNIFRMMKNILVSLADRSSFDFSSCEKFIENLLDFRMNSSIGEQGSIFAQNWSGLGEIQQQYNSILKSIGSGVLKTLQFSKYEDSYVSSKFNEKDLADSIELFCSVANDISIRSAKVLNPDLVRELIEKTRWIQVATQTSPVYNQHDESSIKDESSITELLASQKANIFEAVRLAFQERRGHKLQNDEISFFLKEVEKEINSSQSLYKLSKQNKKCDFRYNLPKTTNEFKVNIISSDNNFENSGDNFKTENRKTSKEVTHRTKQTKHSVEKHNIKLPLPYSKRAYSTKNREYLPDSDSDEGVNEENSLRIENISNISSRSPNISINSGRKVMNWQRIPLSNPGEFMKKSPTLNKRY